MAGNRLGFAAVSAKGENLYYGAVERIAVNWSKKDEVAKIAGTLDCRIFIDPKFYLPDIGAACRMWDTQKEVIVRIINYGKYEDMRSGVLQLKAKKVESSKKSSSSAKGFKIHEMIGRLNSFGIKELDEVWTEGFSPRSPDVEYEDQEDCEDNGSPGETEIKPTSTKSHIQEEQATGKWPDTCPEKYQILMKVWEMNPKSWMTREVSIHGLRSHPNDSLLRFWCGS